MKKETVMIVCGWYQKGGESFCLVSGKDYSFFDHIIGFEAKNGFDIEKELSFFDISFLDKRMQENRSVKNILQKQISSGKLNSKQLNDINKRLKKLQLEFGQLEKSMRLLGNTTHEQTPKKVKLYNKAVWVNNNGVEFYEAESSGSSTVLQGKKTGVFFKTYKADSCDFVEFLNNFPRQKYRLYISMNIEGAEFQILEDMFQRKVFDNVDIHEFHLDNHTNIAGEEIKLKEQVKKNHRLLLQYFRGSKQRLASCNPEDIFYFN